MAQAQAKPEPVPNSTSVSFMFVTIMMLVFAIISFSLLFSLDSPILNGFDADGTLYIKKSPARCVQVFGALLLGFLALGILIYLVG